MNLLENLGIETLSASPAVVVLGLTVTEQHTQPFGLLHGGIHTVLAETAASLGANLNLPAAQVAVGASIQTEHLKAVHPGATLRYEARPEHLGRTSQVWTIRGTNQEQLVALATCRLFVVPK